MVGSTLSLTGSFAATGIIHKAAGETFVRWINANGGVLGRRLDWKVLDDESDPAKVTALYERLISQDKVDLIMGPYATPNIVAAQAVAERHGYVLPNHTAVLTYALNYRCQFPTWSTGAKPNLTVPRTVFTAIKTQRKVPKRVAFVTNTGGSTNFISYGPPNSSEGGAVEEARKAGFDVVLDLKYPPTVSDWGSIAAQVRAANPDFVWNSGLATDPVGLIQAMDAAELQAAADVHALPGARAAARARRPREQRALADALRAERQAAEADGQEGAEHRHAVRGAGGRQPAQLPRVRLAGHRVLDGVGSRSWPACAARESVDNERVCNYLRSNAVNTTFTGRLQVHPGDEQLLGRAQPRQADPEQALGGRLAACAPGREAPGPEVERNRARGAG